MRFSSVPLNPGMALKSCFKDGIKKKVDHTLTGGQGSITQAVGIAVEDSGTSLMSNLIWLEDQTKYYKNQDILASPRVGVQYAGKDANNPWRFQLENNPWVSPAS